MSTKQTLEEKSIVFVFAYAPAGLGHLRVTDALYHGLSEEITPILLGAQDISINAIHRFITIHPITRAVFEWFQKGLAQEISTFFYREFLRAKTKLLYQQLTTILDQRIDVPTRVIVVATHFGLAHQLAVIKKRIEHERKITVMLFVQVTDDSPQPIWYVPDSTMIFVPSEYTKEKLLKYGKRSHLPESPITVIPYPISPSLAKTYTSEEFAAKKQQADPQSNSHIHIALPISGAAVGTEFSTKLIDFLHKKSNRFQFHVIVRQALYTQTFLTEMLSRPFVNLLVSTSDRKTVDNYEDLYKKTTIVLEVTKPSEQSFKALFSPHQRGGSILLFADPVGQQEHDNLAFLHRHHIIPTKTQMELFWRKAEKEEPLADDMKTEILQMAKTWRGLILPKHSKASSHFIWWALQQGILEAMLSYTMDETNEISPNGVEAFWKNVAQTINLVDN